MKKTLVSMLAIAVLAGSISLSAQTTDVKAPRNSILSGQQQIMIDKTPSPLPIIDEYNVMWKKTVIREIDFRQILFFHKTSASRISGYGMNFLIPVAFSTYKPSLYVSPVICAEAFGVSTNRQSNETAIIKTSFFMLLYLNIY